jgi:hypothetical protein
VPATKKSRNAERSFGLSVGGVLCAIALLLLWRGRVWRAEWLGAAGAFLVGAGLAYPRILTLPNAYWSRLARVLGYVNSRVLLTLVFAAVFVPVSLIWRLAGSDPLGRRRARWPGWVPAPPSHRERGHYARMY